MQSARFHMKWIVASFVLILVALTARWSTAAEVPEEAAVVEVGGPTQTDNSSSTATQPQSEGDKHSEKENDKDTAKPLTTTTGKAKGNTPTPAKRRTPASSALLDAKLVEAKASVVPNPAVTEASRDTDKQKATAADEPLTPVPEFQDAEPQDSNSPDAKPVAIETASFNGVIPGVSTKDDVEKAWGKPEHDTTPDGSATQLFSVEPFKHVEVTYSAGKVASLLIRFDHSYPTAAVEKQLNLVRIRPVLVSNDLGELLGLSYPECGVLAAFESGEPPAKPSMKVTHIILEPISAEPFILRAETMLDRRSDLSRLDLEQAFAMERDNARAHWLYSRVLARAEDYPKALRAASEAIRLEPDNAHYRVTRAQILGQLGRLTEAAQEAQKAADLAAQRPHVKARALCLRGDLLASGPKPDYRKAIVFHTQAIQSADPLTNDPHPAVRIAAKEVLLDGHLGAAHDIAWGDWKEKEKAVPRWFERAAALADDLVNSEGASQEHRFRVHSRALAAYIGVRGALDPAQSAKEVLATGEALIAAAEDPVRKAQYEWDLGMSLYDAMQVFQMRSQSEEAVKYGEATVAHLEQADQRALTPENALLLGRLYFRLGALNAIRDNNHRAATAWFDKAAPLLEQSQSAEIGNDVGRHGEMLVSMGVSYWEVGQQDKALRLTQRGITDMERGVEQGSFDRSSLAAPYHNLATMHRQRGSSDLADHFQELASRVKNEKMK